MIFGIGCKKNEIPQGGRSGLIDWYAWAHIGVIAVIIRIRPSIQSPKFHEFSTFLAVVDVNTIKSVHDTHHNDSTLNASQEDVGFRFLRKMVPPW